MRIRETRGVTFLLALAIHAGIWLIPSENRPDECAETLDTMEIAVVDFTHPGSGLQAGFGGPASSVPYPTNIAQMNAAANPTDADRVAAISRETSEPMHKLEPVEMAPEPSVTPVPEIAPPAAPAGPLPAGMASDIPSGTTGVVAPAPQTPESVVVPGPSGPPVEGGTPGAAVKGPAQTGGGPGSDGTASASAGDPKAVLALAYAANVSARLQMFHRYPFWAKKGNISGEVTLRLTIAKNGRLAEAKIEGTSGHSGLDADALETAKRAAPYPAIPSALKKDVIHVIVRLIYSLKKG